MPKFSVQLPGNVARTVEAPDEANAIAIYNAMLGIRAVGQSDDGKPMQHVVFKVDREADATGPIALERSKMPDAQANFVQAVAEAVKTGVAQVVGGPTADAPATEAKKGK